MSESSPSPALPPEIVMFQLITGSWVQQAISVAAELGIADLLKESPQTVDSLAGATNSHANSLYRVLRMLASIGIFRETEPRVFGLTPLAEFLRGDVPNSVRAVSIFHSAQFVLRPWEQILHSVKTGETAFDHVYGKNFFEYAAENPTAGEIFNNAMTEQTAGTRSAILNSYDFSQVGTLVDVGGGHGQLLATVLKANPRLRGILFDLPHVVSGVPALLAQAGVADRMEVSAGSFFESVPPGGDAYILTHIIHDWDDDRSNRILSVCRAAMKPTARLLLGEMVIPAGNEPFFGKLLDLQMLVMTPGGRERTEAEYRTLLAGAGFELTRIIPTASPISVIEAKPM